MSIYQKRTPACPPLEAVRGIGCRGNYCDDLQLTCEPFTGRFYSGARWTPWFSEEGTNYAYCNTNEVASGLRCSGNYCDNLSLRCQRTDQVLTNCSWEGPYSDERSPYVDNRGRFLRGMWCTGSYCDNKWYLMCQAPLPPRPPQVALVGDTTCAPGASDCNVCAFNVEQQVRDAFDPIYPRTTWQTHAWNFNWTIGYPPDYLTPAAVFDGNYPVAKKHTQGFVRTNSSIYPFAGTYSDDVTGSMFVVGTGSGTSFHLRSIHAANTPHPSGLHTIGRYVVFAEDDEPGLRAFGEPVDGHRVWNRAHLRAAYVRSLRAMAERVLASLPCRSWAARADAAPHRGLLTTTRFLLLSSSLGGDRLRRRKWNVEFLLS